MALSIYTANIIYKGKDKLNITVKDGNLVFAPTWFMVNNHMNGRLSDKAYTKMYYAMMRKSYKFNFQEWDKLLKSERVTLCCYCRPGKFCHRHLLADILVKCGAVYVGEVRKIGGD